MSDTRKSFEHWYSGGGVLCKSVERSPAGGYRLMQAQQAWLAWMACADHFAAQRAPVAPRFADVSCSQCGRSFGPGNHGFSHCDDHAPK